MSAAILTLALAAAVAAFEPTVANVVNPRDQAAAVKLGLSVVGQAPDQSAVDAADADGRLVDFWRLRLLWMKPLAQGRASVCVRLPAPPPGRALVDFPEEWQALSRVARQWRLMRPILKSAAPADHGFELPSGVLGRAWRSQGRLYVLLVNPTDAPAALTLKSLAGYRALFEARADAREVLTACGLSRCLEPGRVLWLESAPGGARP